MSPDQPPSAQVVQFEFSGTRFGGSEDFGETISGIATLDLDALPSITQPFTPDDGCGEYAVWSNADGEFAVQVETSGGQVADSSAGGITYFEVIDDPCYGSPGPLRYGHLHWAFEQDGVETGIRFLTHNYGEAGDGVAAVSDWKPAEDSFTFIRIYFYDISAEVNHFSDYRLDSFEPVVQTIVIDGCDTGVDDFEYNGGLVSELLDEVAADARSHGQYVSQVKKLLRELQRPADHIRRCGRDRNVRVGVHHRPETQTGSLIPTVPGAIRLDASRRLGIHRHCWTSQTVAPGRSSATPPPSGPASRSDA